jgi:hypothetical protein
MGRAETSGLKSEIRNRTLAAALVRFRISDLRPEVSLRPISNLLGTPFVALGNHLDGEDFIEALIVRHAV